MTTESYRREQKNEPTIAKSLRDLQRALSVALAGGEQRYGEKEAEAIAQKIFAQLEKCETMDEAARYLWDLDDNNQRGGVPLRDGLPLHDMTYLYSKELRKYYLVRKLAEEAHGLAQLGEARLRNPSFSANSVSRPLRPIINRVRAIEYNHQMRAIDTKKLRRGDVVSITTTGDSSYQLQVFSSTSNGIPFVSFELIGSGLLGYCAQKKLEVGKGLKLTNHKGQVLREFLPIIAMEVSRGN